MRRFGLCQGSLSARHHLTHNSIPVQVTVLLRLVGIHLTHPTANLHPQPSMQKEKMLCAHHLEVHRQPLIICCSFSSTGGTVDSQTTKSEDLIVVQTQVPYQSLWSSGIGKSSAHHHHPFSFPSPSSARIPQTPTNSPDPSVPQPLPASSIDVVIHTSIPHTKPPCFNHLAMIDILDKLRVARQAVTQLETDLQNTVDTIVGTRLCP